MPDDHPPISTIFRTGLLLAASMPVSNSTCPARPTQPSWRILEMKSRIGMARCRSGVCTFVQHPVLATAVAGDAHEPRQEHRQRLVERLACGDQRVVTVACQWRVGIGRASRLLGRLRSASAAGDLALHLAASFALPSVFPRCHVGRTADPGSGVLHSDDRRLAVVVGRGRQSRPGLVRWCFGRGFDRANYVSALEWSAARHTTSPYATGGIEPRALAAPSRKGHRLHFGGSAPPGCIIRQTRSLVSGETSTSSASRRCSRSRVACLRSGTG